MNTNSSFAGLPVNIFSRMSALAVEHNAINLGQGFPDEDGPVRIREVAARALIEGPNQYPSTRGILPLRRAISEHARREYSLEYDPEMEVLVTSGASEAIANAIMGLVAPGEEIVFIEPAYDSYRPIAQAIGARIRSIVLQPPLWQLTEETLRKTITSRTKAIVLNTPLNPLGKVFSTQELEDLARVISDTDALVICDEVYEHIVYDGRRHIPLATLPGMHDRVVRVGSAGKMFSLTGWKIGWIMGPASLVQTIANTHQYITFTTWNAGQIGTCYALEHEMQYTYHLLPELQRKRDLVCEGLRAIGFKPLTCDGTYFATADITSVTNENDTAFCEKLAREARVALVPLSAFFFDGEPKTFVRLAFCKKDNVLEAGLGRLRAFLGR